jgi:uncharacterized protein
MKLTILASESFGVRSMACVVQAGDKKIVIDPGVALGAQRFRLPPHPQEQEVARQTRERLRNELSDATHVVITHFHGDHHPMVEADPYQLSAADVLSNLKRLEILAKGNRGVSKRQKHRRRLLEKQLGNSIPSADGRNFGDFTFSEPMPHGEPINKAGTVIMLRISYNGTTFVHGSDIQLLDHRAIDMIERWRPDIVFLAGPPIYLIQGLPNEDEIMDEVEKRLDILASCCGTIILDHHVMRSREGETWLDQKREKYGNICCAAGYEKRERNLLEADRQQLYNSGGAPTSNPGERTGHGSDYSIDYSTDDNLDYDNQCNRSPGETKE